MSVCVPRGLIISPFFSEALCFLDFYSECWHTGDVSALVFDDVS